MLESRAKHSIVSDSGSNRSAFNKDPLLLLFIDNNLIDTENTTSYADEVTYLKYKASLRSRIVEANLLIVN